MASVAHKIPTTQQISCCGLALSPDLIKVAVGDMVGNIWIYQLGETPPCHHQNVSNHNLCMSFIHQFIDWDFSEVPYLEKGFYCFDWGSWW